MRDLICDVINMLQALLWKKLSVNEQILNKNKNLNMRRDGYLTNFRMNFHLKDD